uniref:CCHC-type domain-containing protein n=1 Tax=Tanacetum cinerariifolium TaxID=118510 RepID=A0A6L2M305_TANCI|nr:hypothetical protein [Tanacetum cinerariifolium]
MLQGIPTASYGVPLASAFCHFIEFGDSYKASPEETGKGPASESSTKKNGRTVVITTEYMQKRRNDVKARTTLLLALLDEHQLRFSKYETAKELWEAILKTFGGNEATKKTKKNQLKQQYGNFKDEVLETLEQTFNRLFWKRTGKKITIQGFDVAGFDKSKVECFNCHKLGHFSRECRAPRSQDRANDEALTEFALVAKSSSSSEMRYMTILTVLNHKRRNDVKARTTLLLALLDEHQLRFSKYETAKELWEAILKTFGGNEATKKTKKNQLKQQYGNFKDEVLETLEQTFNRLSGKGKVHTTSVPTASIQVSTASTDVVAASLSHDTEENHVLVANDEALTEFALVAKSSSSSEMRPTPSIDASKCNTSDLQSSNFSISEHGESLGSNVSKTMIKFVKAADCPRVIKTNNTKNARKSTVKYAEMYRNTLKSPKIRGKTCPKNNFAHKSMSPRAVLLKPGTSPIAVNRPNMNAAQPKMTSFVKTAHSNVKRHFQGKLAVITQPRFPRVFNVTKIFPTVDSKFPTAKSTFTADLRNKGKAVKASAWIWRPKQNTIKKRVVTKGTFSNGLHWDSVVNMCIIVLHRSDSEQSTHEFMHVYLVFASVYVWIGNFIMAKLAFCDYHNMIAILEKTEHNIDFHQIVDFLEASYIRYALTISPVVYVSHIRQFWSTARIETTNQETKILATVDGKSRTIFESSLRSYLKLSDEERISSLPDAKLFENLSLMGYNILPNQRSTFQKGQFSHQWKQKRRGAEPTQEDAPITGGIMEIKDELGAEKSTELGSNDTEEMVNVLSSMEAANILTSRVAAASVSPAEVFSAAGVPTVGGSFPTVSAIFTTTSVKVVESKVSKKRKLQEQIDAQVAKEMEEEFARENQRLNEQLTRDSEISRLHAEEELKMMIEGLDRSNEVIAKHLQEYKQAEADLSVGEKLKLISELVKYQDHLLKSHAGWKTKHFRGMKLEQLKEKFIPVWKQFEDFVPMNSKEESERIKRQGLKIDQGSLKRIKTSKSVSEDVFEEELKEMMQLVHLEEVYVEALQATKDKEKELCVELKRLFELDFKDQLWTHNQAFMHDPLDWKLYDTCGVHHVSTKDQEIFMLVERDYPLRRGLATMMIYNKLQAEQYSHMANDLILKIHNIANSPR